MTLFLKDLPAFALLRLMSKCSEDAQKLGNKAVMGKEEEGKGSCLGIKIGIRNIKVM